MTTTVPAHTPARQASSHSTGVKLSALPLVSVAVFHGLTGRGPTPITVVILVLVLVVVVPAVWSGKGYRRRAGLDVLDRLLPLRG